MLKAMHVIYEYRDFATALATVLIAIFTYTLYRATKGLVESAWVQSKDMKRSIIASETAATAASTQAEIAKKSLSVIERPYIFVFNISVPEIVEDVNGDFLRVTYSVANYGKTPAVIENGRVSLSVFADPLQPANLDFNHPLAVSPILAASEVRNCEETLAWSGGFTFDEDGSRIPSLDDDSLWFWATFAYRGPFTSGHENSTLRRYDERTGRFFISLPTQELNYEK
jgi:hypothetical protein